MISMGRLKLMTSELGHRGPDDEGHWINDTRCVGLGALRLSIIDLSSAGSQPLHYLNRYTIVFNGEIYNHVELRSELVARGYQFRSGTDTEVITAAYDRYREKCLDHFEGMFAFAIWDEQEKKLFGARDRLGEKPFFYHYSDKAFMFASEMKALWACEVARKPNLKLLFNFLTIGYVDNPDIPEETFYEEIHKLPAASYFEYSSLYHKLEINNYWDLEQTKDHNIITSENDALEKFRDLLANSVRLRLRSDVSSGTNLSGGLDSSAIVSLCSESDSPNYSHQCFTAIFPGFDKDEKEKARIVAQHFSLEQHFAEVSGVQLLDELKEVFHYQEEPFTSASVFAQFKLYELAKEKGVKVLLDGQGADETLAGYSKYYKWYWQELFRKRRLASSKEISCARELGVKEDFTWKNKIAALSPEFASIFLEKKYILKALAHEDLEREFVTLQSKEAYYAVPDIFSLNGVLYFNTFIHGLEELLRYADRNSMAHSRELRLPFLDTKLLEFVFSLPPEYKIHKGWTKWILRKVMEGNLPDETTWRRDKIGFEPPQKQWMNLPGFHTALKQAKEILVKEKILNKSVLNKQPSAHNAYDAEGYDWRYLTASMLFL